MRETKDPEDETDPVGYDQYDNPYPLVPLDHGGSYRHDEHFDVAFRIGTCPFVGNPTHAGPCHDQRKTDFHSGIVGGQRIHYRPARQEHANLCPKLGGEGGVFIFSMSLPTTPPRRLAYRVEMGVSQMIMIEELDTPPIEGVHYSTHWFVAGGLQYSNSLFVAVMNGSLRCHKEYLLSCQCARHVTGYIHLLHVIDDEYDEGVLYSHAPTCSHNSFTTHRLCEHTPVAAIFEIVCGARVKPGWGLREMIWTEVMLPSGRLCYRVTRGPQCTYGDALKGSPVTIERTGWFFGKRYAHLVPFLSYGTDES